MEKYATPNAASSPVTQEASPVVKKNDSFLEDVGLVPYGRNSLAANREAERNVTRRTTSPVPGPHYSEITTIKHETVEKSCLDLASVKGRSTTIRGARRQELGSGDRPQPQDLRAAAAAAKESGRGGKPYSQESGAKSKTNSDLKIAESRAKLQIDKRKLSNQERKSSGRRSSNGCVKEKEKSLEVSDDCKHSSSSSSSSGRSKIGIPPSETGKDHQRRSDGSTQQKIETSKEVSESVALLSAIKDIVSTYTKEEGVKMSRMMNELHILGQANIIKNFIFQNDEIRKAREYSVEYRALLEENKILQDNFELLKIKYENALRENEDMKRIKEENIALKLKLQELAACESSS